MFHSSALRKLKERAGLLSDIGSFRRALCSRRDLEIRRQLCKVDKVRILRPPSYTNRFFLLVWYNKLGIVHCTYLGMSGYNFKKQYCILLSEELIYLYKQCRPWWSAALCCMSSGYSSLQKYLFRGDFWTYIRRYTSPNENFEYGYPHSNALLTFPFKKTVKMYFIAPIHPTTSAA